MKHKGYFKVLEVRGIERVEKREKETETSFCMLILSSDGHSAGCWSSRSQEPGISSESPTWMVAAQVLELSSATFPSH